jgi:hypothetical protein
MLTTLNSQIAAAASMAEVAHCRTLEQKKEQVNCFKSLKLGHHTKLDSNGPPKTDEPTFAKLEGWTSAQIQSRDTPNGSDIIVPKTTPPPSAAPKLKSTLAKTSATPQEGAPPVTKQTPPTTREQGPAAYTNQNMPTTPNKLAVTQPKPAASEPLSQAGRSSSAKVDQAPPGGQTRPARMNETTPLPTTDDSATTGSINRLDPVGRPLCVDPDALVAMLIAGMLTSNPQQAVTEGCRTIPEDAKLTRLERYPSVFPIVRIVRVKVTSLTHPELTTGFTIETGR